MVALLTNRRIPMGKTTTTSRRNSTAQAAKRTQRRRRRVARRSNRRGPLARPEVRADDPTLTRFAGLLPLIFFMTEQLRIPERLQKVAGYRGRSRVHAPHVVLFAFVVAALAGVERLAHLDWLRDDIALVRYCRLAYWPVRKVFSGALTMVSERGVRLLEEFIGELGLEPIRGATSVVVDIDPTAIVDHGQAEGGKFGYCGKGRRRRRHFPLVASVAQTRTVVMAKYRDGSKLTADEMLTFIEAAIERVKAAVADGATVFLRADSEFWCPRIGRRLNELALPFVMASPMNAGVKLMLHQARFLQLTDDEDIDFASLEGSKTGHGDGVRIVIVRRRVHDPKAPPMGKLIPGFDKWRHQAIVTNQLDWGPVDVWRFYNGRADCERIFRVGKQTLAMSHLVGTRLRANEVAFLLRLLAFNADMRFQLHSEARAIAEGRPVQRLGLEWRQFRFFNAPGRLLRRAHGYLLRVPQNQLLADVWAFYAPELMACLTEEANAA